MLQNIVIIVVLLVAGFVVFVATRPATFQVQRAGTIKASAATIFPLINDFHSWASWSPWEKLDPALRRTHSGAASGKGAVYEWEGNKKVGKGRMEITDTAAPSRIVIKLDFLQPFEAHNVTEFTLAPAGDSTTVSWVMRGSNNFMGKAMHIFFNMDKLVGGDFEKGLANLKSITEK